MQAIRDLSSTQISNHITEYCLRIFRQRLKNAYWGSEALKYEATEVVYNLDTQHIVILG